MYTPSPRVAVQHLCRRQAKTSRNSPERRALPRSVLDLQVHVTGSHRRRALVGGRLGAERLGQGGQAVIARRLGRPAQARDKPPAVTRPRDRVYALVGYCDDARRVIWISPGLTGNELDVMIVPARRAIATPGSRTARARRGHCATVGRVPHGARRTVRGISFCVVSHESRMQDPQVI